MWISPLQSEKQKPYGPKGVADEARAWVKEHISEGLINGAKVRINLIPGDFTARKMPKTSIEAMVPFKQVEADYFPPFPTLKDGMGEASLFSDSMKINLTNGKIAGSAIDSAKIVISGFDKKMQNISLDAKIKGPAKDLIDADKIIFGNYLGNISFTGDADTRIMLSCPLSDDQFYSNIRFSVFPTVENFNLILFLGKKYLMDFWISG